MIDRATGRIQPDGLVIEPSLTKTAFLAATSMPSSEGRVMGDRWTCGIERPWQGKDWYFTLSYVGEVLQSVGMGYANLTVPTDYGEWVGFHYAHLRDYEAFLGTWLGDWRQKFPWGTATVWFDEKGIGSGMFVEYRKRDT